MGISAWSSGLFRTAEEAHSLDRLYFEKLEEAEVEIDDDEFYDIEESEIPDFIFEDIPCECFKNEEAQGFETFSDCEE